MVCSKRRRHLTVFCIFVAICSVRSAVVPPAPQVISQKVGFNAAILSCLMKRFSTPCNDSLLPPLCILAEASIRQAVRVTHTLLTYMSFLFPAFSYTSVEYAWV